ncbi:MAG: hypothetical protein GW938_09390 [Leptospira sp.]|nr:hypothetical protein [Leptospira sp.]NCS94687.1 hypothetical protein [Leptospira sp.]
MQVFTEQQLNQLEEIDRILINNSISYLSLCPDKKYATPIKKLIEQEQENFETDADINNWIDFCHKLIEESVSNFRENIFWDFDFLIHSLVIEYKVSSIKQEFIENRKEKIKSIFRLFGSKSLIRFKYLHDFLYGYDWYKWQTQSQESSNELKPFGDSFLNYIESRGKELIELIERNDTNYPALENEESRNPFYFSRDKEEETLLWKSLAKDNLIPIPSWQRKIPISLSHNFSEIRNQRAIDLQITSNQSPGVHKI